MRAFVGGGVANLMHRAAPQANDEEHAVLLKTFKAHYAQHMTDKTRPYPGIMDMLMELKRRGIPCAVVSNKFNAAARKVCAECLGDFPAVVIGEGEGVAKKPDPAGCFLALETLGVSAEGAVYVGDSDVDAKTARNAGLPCILVSWGFRPRSVLEETGETRICDTVEELTAWFDKGENA